MLEHNEELENRDQLEWERHERIIQSHAAQLSERFETVQIICTQHNPQMGTRKHCAGSGNAFARIAATEEWVKQSKKL